MRSSSIFKNIEVVFHILSSLVIIRLQKLRLSSIFKIINVYTFNNFGCIILNEVVFHLKKKDCLLPFPKKMRLSSIFKNIEVVFHILSSLVIIRLHTKNQPPKLPATALNVMTLPWWWCGGLFLPIIIPPQQKLF